MKNKTISGLTKRLGSALIGATMLGISISPSAVYACGNKENVTFWSLIKDIAKNPEIEKTDKDGIIYIRWDDKLETLNGVSTRPEEYVGKINSTEGREQIFNTSEDAMRNAERDTRYLVGIDVNHGLNYGQIREVFQLPQLKPGQSVASGKWLRGSLVYRCLGSPLKFEEETK